MERDTCNKNKRVKIRAFYTMRIPRINQSSTYVCIDLYSYHYEADRIVPDFKIMEYFFQFKKRVDWKVYNLVILLFFQHDYIYSRSPSETGQSALCPDKGCKSKLQWVQITLGPAWACHLAPEKVLSIAVVIHGGFHCSSVTWKIVGQDFSATKS